MCECANCKFLQNEIIALKKREKQLSKEQYAYVGYLISINGWSNNVLPMEIAIKFFSLAEEKYPKFKPKLSLIKGGKS